MGKKTQIELKGCGTKRAILEKACVTIAEGRHNKRNLLPLMGFNKVPMY